MIRLYFFLWIIVLLALTGAWFFVRPFFSPKVCYWMGWAGFGIMCLTNLYVLRKKLPALQNSGKPARWLDFHIFCGLVGPTLVVFHTHFKVDGLVAISFWSMVISFASGVVGRYFYTQLLQQRGHLKGRLKQFEAGFAKVQTAEPEIYTAKAVGALKIEATRLAFGGYKPKAKDTNLGMILACSMLGDLRLLFAPLPAPAGFSPLVRKKFKEYGLMQRKVALLDAYKRLMGYWHTFHVPFAVFMYVVAVIHIVAELLFRVS